jgi:hypothetical protein
MDNPSAPITSKYTLTSPVGKNTVISPITTLVAAKINSGLSMTAAEAATKTDLGMTSIDVYKNYIDAKKTDTTYQQLHNLAAATAEVLKNVESTGAGTAIQTLAQKLNQLSAKFPNMVGSQLASIKSASDAGSASSIAGEVIANKDVDLTGKKFIAISVVDDPCGVKVELNDSITFEKNTISFSSDSIVASASLGSPSVGTSTSVDCSIQRSTKTETVTYLQLKNAGILPCGPICKIAELNQQFQGDYSNSNLNLGVFAGFNRGTFKSAIAYDPIQKNIVINRTVTQSQIAWKTKMVFFIVNNTFTLTD